MLRERTLDAEEFAEDRLDRAASVMTTVEKLRMEVDKRTASGLERAARSADCRDPSYAAPKRTETSFDTPGSCMVTP